MQKPGRSQAVQIKRGYHDLTPNAKRIRQNKLKAASPDQPTEQDSGYRVGLDSYRESVISAHFMDEHVQDESLSLYSQDEYRSRSIEISRETLKQELIPAILNSSRQFVEGRVSAITTRARKNFAQYGLASAGDIGACETIAETMFDRQLVKGPKANYSRLFLAEQVSARVAQVKPIRMIIPSLPYKSDSPIKSRSRRPDLSELGFILGLAEIAQIIDGIYRQIAPDVEGPLATFTIISDGRRFNEFLNEPNDVISDYQSNLGYLVKITGLDDVIKIIDYKQHLQQNLPANVLLQKDKIRQQTIAQYDELMLPILDENNVPASIERAVSLDPDSEQSHIDGRFVPLFRSLVYTARFSLLQQYANNHGQSYDSLYLDLIRKLFEPIESLTSDDYRRVQEYIRGTPQDDAPPRNQILETLRRSMLQEAWRAAIHYIAEIKSDRELPEDPILTCFPDHIRWTIHAKVGQLAVLTPTALGSQVQPWHAMGVFGPSRNGRIKLYALPVLYLEGIGATPVVLSDEPDSPVCYVN